MLLHHHPSRHPEDYPSAIQFPGRPSIIVSKGSVLGCITRLNPRDESLTLGHRSDSYLIQ